MNNQALVKHPFRKY